MTSWILEARGLSRSFGGFVALNDVTLKVREGTIHTLIGPNGAGKTTLFNVLTRFLAPNSGEIVFEGRDVTHTPPAALARAGMVRSFQISSTFGSLTALENVRAALQRRRAPTYNFWRSDHLLDGLDDEAMSYLEKVGLAAHAGAEARTLSYGLKRALELASTLAMQPKLLLLDEPIAGISRSEIARITDLIREVAVGRTVLMVEHNLPVVAELSDHITVLSRGAVLAEGPYETVSKDQRVIDAYLGGPDDE